MNEPIRVLVVDDSAYVRRTLRRQLQRDGDIQVVGTAADGSEALSLLESLDPDVITVDLEMPKFGGFPFIRVVMSRKPRPIIVVSSYAGRNDVLRALDLGALDFVAKPTKEPSEELASIGQVLREKVREAARAKLEVVLARRRSTGLYPTFRGTVAPPVATEPSRPADGIVVVAASTGGPSAVRKLLEEFDPRSWAVGLVLHMPPRFTTAFAARLSSKTGREIREAADGMHIGAGLVFLAPGGVHTVVAPAPGGWAQTKILPDTDREAFCPSADRLLSSAAGVFGKRTVAVVLTGMGSDGTEGARAVKEAGGYVMAESEESAVVYGMPRRVVEAGLCDETVSLETLPARLEELIRS